MKKLLELEAKLIKAKEELDKSLLGDMNPVEKMEDCGDMNMAKEDEIKGCDDKDKAKKIMEAEMDEHNEKKHGEAKDADSAKKSDIPKEITDQPAGDIVEDASNKGPLEKRQVIFYPNGQWALEKSDHMDPRANGEFDVPVEEVYNGDDEFVHVGERGVDGDDKGRTDKIADREKKILKD